MQPMRPRCVRGGGRVAIELRTHACVGPGRQADVFAAAHPLAHRPAAPPGPAQVCASAPTPYSSEPAFDYYPFNVATPGPNTMIASWDFAADDGGSSERCQAAQWLCVC